MDKIENRYTGELGEQYHANKHFLNDEVKEMMAEKRVKKFLRFVKPETRLLEYGVGGGFNIKNLVCKEKDGFDIATSIKDQVEKLGIRFIDSEDKIPIDYYDVIICNHVLEHVPNPIETLSIIKSKLHKDGKLLLALPYERAKRFSKYNSKDKDYHLYSWTVQTLTYLVSQVGYKCIESHVLDYGYDRYTSSLISKYKLPKFTFNIIFYVLNRIRPGREIFLVLQK